MIGDSVQWTEIDRKLVKSLNITKLIGLKCLDLVKWTYQ